MWRFFSNRAAYDLKLIASTELKDLIEHHEKMTDDEFEKSIEGSENETKAILDRLNVAGDNHLKNARPLDHTKIKYESEVYSHALKLRHVWRPQESLVKNCMRGLTQYLCFGSGKIGRGKTKLNTIMKDIASIESENARYVAKKKTNQEFIFINRDKVASVMLMTGLNKPAASCAEHHFVKAFGLRHLMQVAMPSNPLRDGTIDAMEAVKLAFFLPMKNMLAERQHTSNSFYNT